MARRRCGGWVYLGLQDAMSNKDEGDCSGTRFYHWGALTGMIGLMEDGLF